MRKIHFVNKIRWIKRYSNKLCSGVDWNRFYRHNDRSSAIELSKKAASSNAQI